MANDALIKRLGDALKAAEEAAFEIGRISDRRREANDYYIVSALEKLEEEKRQALADIERDFMAACQEVAWIGGEK